MERQQPYLIEKRVVTVVERFYNPAYGDDRVCECGHPYRRHFDKDEGMKAVGCKYCDCMEFVEASSHFDDPNNIHETVVFDQKDDVNVELVEEETPLAEYMASGTKVPYVEWLEAKLEELVPECMKTWKKGL